MVKNLPAMQETWVRSLDQKDALEKVMATHSSILGLENPMDRGAWWATVHGVAKRHDRVTNTLIFHYSVQQRALADWLGRSLEKGVSPGVCSLPSH